MKKPIGLGIRFGAHHHFLFKQVEGTKAGFPYLHTKNLLK